MIIQVYLCWAVCVYVSYMYVCGVVYNCVHVLCACVCIVYMCYMYTNCMLTTGYGCSRPHSIISTYSPCTAAGGHSGAHIGLVAFITHIGCYWYKLPPTIAGNKYFTIGYDNGSHCVLIVLTLRIIGGAYNLQFTKRTICWGARIPIAVSACSGSFMIPCTYCTVGL